MIGEMDCLIMSYNLYYVLMLNKKEFTANELVYINKLGLVTKKISSSPHPLFLYPLTIKPTDDGVSLKHLLSESFSGMSYPTPDDTICDTFSRLVFICREYDGSETYYWITDVNPTNFPNYIVSFIKNFKKGGIFYA